MDNGKYYLKVVSIANTYEDAEKMFEEFKQKISKLSQLQTKLYQKHQKKT